MSDDPVLRCLDCGALYAEFPLDIHLPDEQWRRLVPESECSNGGGVLCASCIVARAAKLPGVTVVYLSIEPPSEAGCTGEQSWKGALAATEAELQRVEKQRRRLMFAARMIRRQIKTGAPWPV